MGGDSYFDNKFILNVCGCRSHNIPFGLYYFLPVNFYRKQYKVVNEIVSLYQSCDFGIWLDFEPEEITAIPEKTQALINIITALKNHGINAGIYASEIAGFKSRLDYDKLSQYPLWVANYNKEPVIPYTIWQKSGSGTCPGIQGAVDLNQMSDTMYNLICPPSDPLHIVAMDVMAGVYGNGNERVDALKSAGHDYSKVQTKINEILRGDA
ncbi:MAG: GH25_LytC-like protein [Podoviridae sp. ctjc_2]|nr:MAG: GH25_LytC-like protein [Podoviridae sp. ctjc_2]